jgi:hypothetical protein
VTERSAATEIDGDLESAGEEPLIVTSGKTSGCTEGEGASPTSSADRDDKEDGGASSGAAVELREGETVRLTETGTEGSRIDMAGARRRSSAETEAVGDIATEGDDSIERDTELSSESVAVAIMELRSDIDSIDSDMSTEDTSDNGFRGMVTAIAVV